MAERDSGQGVTLPQRCIPWPESISPAAVAMLKAADATPSRSSYPPASDHDGWRRVIAETDAIMVQYFAGVNEAGIDGETTTIAGVTCHYAKPAGHDPDDQRVYLDIHGGGLVFGAGEFARLGGIRAAQLHKVASVAVDYRMPPDHPYPAALDDCLSVYAALVAQHGAGNLVVGGSSAGGNLAAALMLRAHDAGLPMPAGLVLMTPEVDLTESGDSFEVLLGLDPVLKSRLPESIALYADGAPLDHPYLSPLFGDLAHFPPTLLQSGTRDLFLSNTVRMHRALRDAGVPAELHVFEAMPHGSFMGAPEDAGLNREIAGFVTRRWQV